MKKPSEKYSPIKTVPQNQPGKASDATLEIIQLKRLNNIIIVGLIMAVAINDVLQAIFTIPPQPIFMIFMVAVSGIWFYYKDKGLRKEKARYKLGSDGEKNVGDILDNLKQQDVKVFHSLVFEGKNKFDIDHVVLSKCGIFAIETKAWSKSGNDRISSNGKVILINGGNPDSEPIDEAIMHARALQSYLRQKTNVEYDVQAVLVYPGWLVNQVVEGKIWVLNPKNLHLFIKPDQNKLTELEYKTAKMHLENLGQSRPQTSR